MLCCRVLTLVCCLPVHGRSGWHLVAQHITSHMVVYVLARGCPTHRSGTWLPNLPTWHTVASHIDMVYDWHLVAQLYGPAHGCPTLRHAIWSAHGCPPCVLVNPAVHIIWFRWTSFILTVILCDIYYFSDSAVTCDVLWTYHSCVHDPAELCIYITNVNPLHSLLIYLTSSTLVYWHTRCSRLLHAPFHVYIASTLFVSTILPVMTLQYYTLPF